MEKVEKLSNILLVNKQNQEEQKQLKEQVIAFLKDKPENYVISQNGFDFVLVDTKESLPSFSLKFLKKNLCDFFETKEEIDELVTFLINTKKSKKKKLNQVVKEPPSKRLKISKVAD